MPSIVELLERLARLEARIGELERDNAGLRRENAVLRAENADLRARLGQDSSNSSRPPSSDGLVKPTPKSLRERPGGQPGHEGRTLRQVADPHERVEHEPAGCGGCGAGLAGAPVTGVAVRQVFDLPDIGVRVVEHRIVSRRCGCGRVRIGQLRQSRIVRRSGTSAADPYACSNSAHATSDRLSNMTGNLPPTTDTTTGNSAAPSWS
ncbi:DUF6444 domain-containing protein [Micromonospora narathiwatensis]|nr:DUF6444 domain-containing protein [Micromonospora narathiwatensis]